MCIRDRRRIGCSWSSRPKPWPVGCRKCSPYPDWVITTITQSGYGEHFLHPTGHGLGLELHEQPILRAGAGATLRRRTAVTVEPGIYLSGLGGVRIEDDVVTTGDAADVLTSSPRHLLVL